jgi:hypothetical protein
MGGARHFVLAIVSHLAIADAHRATIFTFDQGMAKAGAALDIAVRLLKII